MPLKLLTLKVMADRTKEVKIVVIKATKMRFINLTQIRAFIALNVEQETRAARTRPSKKLGVRAHTDQLKYYRLLFQSNVKIR